MKVSSFVIRLQWASWKLPKSWLLVVKSDQKESCSLSLCISGLSRVSANQIQCRPGRRSMIIAQDNHVQMNRRFLVWYSHLEVSLWYSPVLYRQTFFSSRAICSSEFGWFQVHSVQIGSLDVFWLGRSLVKAHERDKPEPVKCNFKSFWTRHFFSNRA